MSRRISPSTLVRSRLGERVRVLNSGGFAETPLARIETSAYEARAWRITLGRAERVDGAPPLLAIGAPNNSAKFFASQVFGYAAGIQNTPASPPLRDARVGTGTDVEPLFVEIAWGMASGALSRMIAHWPMQGGSLVLVGSFIEVTGGSFIVGGTAEAMPVLQATIAPDDGNTTIDANELSLTQDLGLTVAAPAVCYVPDFARRVQVVAADALISPVRVPTTGHPRLVGEWFDDTGASVSQFQWMQGTTIGEPPSWQAVPAAATLLRISTPGANLDCDETFTTLTAFVQWRLSP